MSIKDIGRFPDGRIFIKEGYQPTELAQDGYQPRDKQVSGPPNPPRFESGIIPPQASTPVPAPVNDTNK